MAIKFKEMRRKTDGFHFIFEELIPAGATIYLKMPVVSPNKRSVNDIGWQTDGEALRIYATISADPETTLLWSEVKEDFVVNKTVAYLKVVNDGADCHLCIRALLC